LKERKPLHLTIEDIRPPFNLDLTIKYGAGVPPYYPRTYQCGLYVTVDRLTSGKIILLKIESKGSILKPKLGVTINSIGKLTKPEKQEIIRNLFWSLGLREDLTEFYHTLGQDEILRHVARDLYGMRLYSDTDPFTSCVITICAQNTSYRNFSNMIRLLCQNLGERLLVDDDLYFAFPTAERILDASSHELKQCKVGYRSRYIKDVARRTVDRIINWQLMKQMPAQEVRKKLMEIRGVGPFTTEVMLVYGLRRYEAFWIDTIVRKAISQLYFKGNKISDKEIMKFSKIWGKYRGLVLLYLLCDLDNVAKRFGLSLENPMFEVLR
jgi:3-methyladenine DNA glycosylase/8-oxoguanine DNA glycosylase